MTVNVVFLIPILNLAFLPYRCNVPIYGPLWLLVAMYAGMWNIPEYAEIRTP